MSAAEKSIISRKDKVHSFVSDRKYAMDAVQTDILMDIAGFMEDLTEMTRESFPEGIQIPIALKLTAKQTELTMLTTQANLPWMAFTLFNDGPGDVYFSYNTEYLQEVAPLHKGEKIEVRVRREAISKMILRAVTVANIRLFALK